jgi:hypothetical protein
MRRNTYIEEIKIYKEHRVKHVLEERQIKKQRETD